MWSPDDGCPDSDYDHSNESEGYEMFEIWGGCLDSLSYWDGGSDQHLEDCHSLAEARTARAQWQSQNYAAFIKDKETGVVVS